MCSATLLPDPDSPLTRMSFIEWKLFLGCYRLLPAALSTIGLAGVRGVLVGLLFLVLEHAAVELVGQQVDGGVHVFLGGVGVDGVAAYMQGGFGLLSELLDRQDAMHVDYVIEMARNPFELLFDVRAHRGSDFDMMT